MILIRHTAPAGASGLCYGRLDLDLDATFAAEADRIALALPAGPWRLYSSPALRCRRLAQRLGHAVTIDERLRELDFGAWEGLRWNDLPREELDRWCADFVAARPPGGESFAELADRARSFVAEIGPTERADAPVVAVTHSGVIRALLATARGHPLTAAFSLDVGFGSIHTL